MPHDETMTREDWLKRARIAGRRARARYEGPASAAALLFELTEWRVRHPAANGVIGVGYVFREGWNEAVRDNTPR